MTAEDTDVTLVNVNLVPCNRDIHPGETPEQHEARCPAKPINVPCPIPRSVTFTVRLGECDARHRPGRCFYHDFETGKDADQEHHPKCPARPISVTCFISGKTWAESDVLDAEIPRGENGSLFTAFPDDLAPLRARWALVKVLVLGYNAWDYTMSKATAVPLSTIAAMLDQRDAVFAAIADKARAEEEDDQTTRALIKLVPNLVALDVTRGTAEDYISAVALKRYVSSLVACVASGDLSHA